MTVSVIKEKNDDGSIFSGVCSNHLANAGECRIFVRPSTFRLPKSVATPIIMIGPGTGVAPMRALLQEREFQAKEGKEDGKKMNNVLYFGSKNRKLDYLYADEFAEFEKNGTLSSLHLAFSREQKDKIYVQHLLAKNGKETWDLIEAGAYIYICGGTSMGKDVVKELGKIVSTIGNKNEEQYLALLKKKAGWFRSCGRKTMSTTQARHTTHDTRHAIHDAHETAHNNNKSFLTTRVFWNISFFYLVNLCQWLTRYLIFCVVYKGSLLSGTPSATVCRDHHLP